MSKGWEGKSRMIWSRRRKQWFKRNPPGKNGLYKCAICNKYIENQIVSLDHIIPIRDMTDPDGWKDITNLQATHHKCNVEKGQQ